MSETIATTYYAHGKLLLTAEYFVLDGALALGLPVRFGQQLNVRPAFNGNGHHWTSLGFDGLPWFEGRFSPTGMYQEGSDVAIGQRLEGLLQAIQRQKPGFWLSQPPAYFETRLSFPREWGLGSSSTLVAVLAQWAGLDPFRLLADSFGGSGYDIACALARQPVLFQRHGQGPHFVECPFAPPFASHSCFVYLKRKQDSREGIARYRQTVKQNQGLADRFSMLTSRFLRAASAPEAIVILEEHENLVSQALQLPKVKDRWFADFPGAVKSLGAWGGDFVMAISALPLEVTRQYFRQRGYETAFSWEEMAI
jgi:mevalonate kinase